MHHGCVGGGHKGGSREPDFAEKGSRVSFCVDAVDRSFKRKVGDRRRVRDVEEEALVPHRIEFFLLDGGAEFLAVEFKLDVRVRRALLLGHEIVRIDHFDTELVTTHS